jgi:hypothetical protein
VKQHPPKSAKRECAANFDVEKNLPQMKGLKFTALMAGLCEHDIVHSMLNLQHGERYAYGYRMLLNVIKDQGLNVRKFIYDVVCIFKLYATNQAESDGNSGKLSL